MHCGGERCNLAWPPEPGAQGVSPTRAACAFVLFWGYGCCCGALGYGTDPRMAVGAKSQLLGCTGGWSFARTSWQDSVMAAALCWWVGLAPELAGGLPLPAVYAGGPIH